MTAFLALRGRAKAKNTSSQLEALSPPARPRSLAQMTATATLRKADKPLNPSSEQSTENGDVDTTVDDKLRSLDDADESDYEKEGIC